MDVDLGHLKKPCACGKEHQLQVREIYIEPAAATRLTDIPVSYTHLVCSQIQRVIGQML